MIQIPREDLAAEDIENRKITQLLAQKNADFWAFLEVAGEMNDVIVHIEARPPDSDVILEEGIFKPTDIPTVMYVLYRDHEVTRTLADFQNQLGGIYRGIESMLLSAVANK